MGHQAQIGLGDHIALASEILGVDHVPQAESHVKAAIRHAGDAAGGKRFRRAFTPDGQIGPRGLVELRSGAIHTHKNPAALQVGLDNGGNFLGRLRFAAERSNGDRPLLHANAGNLDFELRQSWQRTEGRYSENRLAPWNARDMSER